MKGFVFISNSSKPSFEKNNSREMIKPGNVSVPSIKVALSMGYQVFLGVNRANPDELDCAYPVRLFDSHTYRSITAIKDNYVAYKNLASIVKNNNVEVIHCNTPVGGMIGRFVGKRYKVKKIIYTAHGFHFYEGAPFLNRTVLKWAEMIMARWTDAIITMNEEDYNAAKRFKLKKNGSVYKVHGVGVNLSEFCNIQVDYTKLRTELDIPQDAIVCISAGDLIKRKNYSTAIEAIAKTDSNVHYIICGIGPEEHRLKSLVHDLNINHRVHFLGFRKDVKELMNISDIFLFTTLQEGLPRSMMEAMACGLPCIASNIRGNNDLLDDGNGGYLIDALNVDDVADKIKRIASSDLLRGKMKEYNLSRIKKYDIGNVIKEIEIIYKKVLD